MALIVLTLVIIFENNNYGTVANDSISGNVVNTQVQLFPVQSKNCSFHLYPGWNQVSFYCLGMFTDRSQVLQSVDGYYGSIFEYLPNVANGTWISYNPYIPNWTIQQLNHMSRTSGYWIYMYSDTNTNDTNITDTSTNFTYAGIYSDSKIYLYKGWNLVGYPNKNTADINISLIGIPFTVVKHYDTMGDSWSVYTNGTTGNTLNKFETYKGYWINVSDDSQWTITIN